MAGAIVPFNHKQSGAKCLPVVAQLQDKSWLSRAFYLYGTKKKWGTTAGWVRKVKGKHFFRQPTPRAKVNTQMQCHSHMIIVEKKDDDSKNKEKHSGSTVTLSLRPRKTVLQKKMQQPNKSRRAVRRWLTSWKGLEEYRDQIRAAAREVFESDAAVRATIPSSVATGFICAAIRDPTTAPSPEVARAGQAQRTVCDLHLRLVWEHNLEWDFVRREWIVILDPTKKGS